MLLPRNILEERKRFPIELQGVIKKEEWEALWDAKEIRIGTKRIRLASTGIFLVECGFYLYPTHPCLCLNKMVNDQFRTMHAPCWSMAKPGLIAWIQMLKFCPGEIDRQFRIVGDSYLYITL